MIHMIIIYHNDIIINVIKQIQKRFPMSPTLSCETCAFSSRQTFIEKPEAGTPGHRSAYKHARLMIHVTWTNLWGVFRLGVLPKITKKNDHCFISLGLALEMIGEVLCVLDHTLSLHTILYCQQCVDFDLNCPQYVKRLPNFQYVKRLPKQIVQHKESD